MVVRGEYAKQGAVEGAADAEFGVGVGSEFVPAAEAHAVCDPC